MQFLFGNVLTGSCVRKDLVTDCNGPLYDGLKQLGAVEFHIENIEVEASVDSAKVGDACIF